MKLRGKIRNRVWIKVKVLKVFNEAPLLGISAWVGPTHGKILSKVHNRTMQTKKQEMLKTSRKVVLHLVHENAMADTRVVTLLEPTKNPTTAMNTMASCTIRLLT